jgi:deoxyribose-phosphate aldolase
MMSEIDIEKIVRSCDHTLLKPEATWEQIRELCDDGARYGTASVCIPPCYARQAVEYLDGRLPVCVVIGFPNGNSTTASKVFEAKEAIDNGVSEVDMVINIGWLKDRKYQEIENEIREIKAAVGSHVLKVIIETCLLSDEEKIRMCEIVTAAGADYIKTSTGFNAGGATFADVELMVQHVGPGVKVKAAGGIASLEDAQKFLDLGASRLGTSRIIKILKAQSI